MSILPDFPVAPAVVVALVATALVAVLARLFADRARDAIARVRKHLDARRAATYAVHEGTGRDVPFELLGAVVLGVCFVLSWDVLVQLARAAGLDHTLSVLYPISIDALAAAAYRAAVRLQHAPWHVRRMPMAVTVSFVALSVVGNALHAWAPHDGEFTVPRGVAAAVSAVPPVSGAVIVHLYALVRRWGGTVAGQVSTSQTAAEPEPDLVALGVQVAAALSAEEEPVNRENLGAGMRARGQELSTPVAQALLVIVRDRMRRAVAELAA